MRKKLLVVTMILLSGISFGGLNVWGEHPVDKSDVATPSTTLKYDQYPVECTMKLEGIGKVLRYRTGENTYVGVNFNLETLYIATAAGSGFKHPAYGIIKNDLRDTVVKYFEDYQNNRNAVALEMLSQKYTMIPQRRFPSDIVSGVLGFREVLSDNVIYQNSKNRGAEQIREQLQEFYQESNAKWFFQNNLSRYNQITASFVANYQLRYVQSLEQFFGMDMSKDRFEVILSPLYFGAEALSCNNLDGSRTYINIINPVYQGGDDWILNALYHETAHNFMEPVFRENSKIIQDYAQYINAFNTEVTGAVKDNFYSYLNEMLARAVTLEMLAKYHNPEMANQRLALEISRGWRDLDDYYHLIRDNYMPQRQKYPKFENFLPVILEYVKARSISKPFKLSYI